MISLNLGIRFDEVDGPKIPGRNNRFLIHFNDLGLCNDKDKKKRDKEFAGMHDKL